MIIDNLRPSPPPGRNGTPAYAQLSGDICQYRRAGFWLRLLAFFLDWCLIQLIILLFYLGTVMAVKIGLDYTSGFSWSSALQLGLALVIPLQVAGLIVVMTYFIFFHGYSGQTPGKQLLGLKVIHTSGLPLTFGQAFLRWVGYLLSALPFNLGFVWAAIDKNKQGWHDKLTDTYVIRVR